MRRDWIRNGLGSGALAAAATAGALFRVGMSAGAPALPFNAIAALLVGPHTVASRGLVPSTVVGITVHAAATITWALGYEWLVARGGGHRWLWGLVVAAAWLLVSGAVDRIAGAGLASAVDLGDRVVVAVVLAVTLAIGMRLAFPGMRRE